MKMTRRELLKCSAAFGVLNVLPARVLWGAGAPSNRLTRAIIGCGAISAHSNHLPFRESRLVGVCDAYRARALSAQTFARANGFGEIKVYRDFIDLLADPGVDIVHICTPPHWHGCMSVMAAKAGKDIWCEKPMTRTVGEGKRVMEVVKARKRMFRLNTWFRYSEGNFYGFGAPVKQLKQLVANDVLGKGPVVCTFGGGQGFDWRFFWSGRLNAKPDPIPAGFDWDMWLGPAPWKPHTFHRAGTSFRGYWDYDAGGIGDMAQHYLDPVQYVLGKDETSPVKVDYLGPRQHPEAVGAFKRVTLWYDDGTSVILDGDRSLAKEPLLRGSNGVCVYPAPDKGQPMRIVDGSGKALDTVKLLAELPEPAPQQTDFMESVRTRRKFCLNEETGFRSATMFNLGTVAMRLGRSFEFDPVNLRAKNDLAADRLLYQPMRDPWHGEMYA